MDVLISWSGKQSRSVAIALKVWLPKVIPSLKPWMSSQDIDKGSRWFNEIQNFLASAKGCIVCMTPENVRSPWIYWETGAIALTQTNPICPLLIGIAPEDIKDDPLSQYQCTYDDKDDVQSLVVSLNQRLEQPEDVLIVEGLFAQHWDELHGAFANAAAMGIPTKVRELLDGIRKIQSRFERRWETDKAAESPAPIKTLVTESVSELETLVQKCKVESRIQHHCGELKSKIGNITYGSREAVHKKGDEIGASFDKAVAAIEADYK